MISNILTFALSMSAIGYVQPEEHSNDEFAPNESRYSEVAEESCNSSDEKEEFLTWTRGIREIPSMTRKRHAHAILGECLNDATDSVELVSDKIQYKYVVTDRNKSWNLDATDWATKSDSPRPRSDGLRVVSVHSNLFGHISQARQSLSVMLAFERLSTAFNDVSFECLVVGIAKKPLPEIYASDGKYSVQQLVGIFSTPPVSNVDLDGVLWVKQQHYSALSALGPDGAKLERTSARTKLVLAQSNTDGSELMTDFEGQGAVPRFLVLDSDGTVIHAFTKMGDQGLSGLREVMDWLVDRKISTINQQP